MPSAKAYDSDGAMRVRLVEPDSYSKRTKTSSE